MKSLQTQRATIVFCLRAHGVFEKTTESTEHTEY